MSSALPRATVAAATALTIGQGATGLGNQRVHPGGACIPRNAPPLFNLTALESLFWDGRVSVDAEGRFRTPAAAAITPAMTRVFEFGPVSALGLFPVLSREEMRAESGDSIIHGVVLPEQVVDQLTAFMTALTDPAVRTLRRRVPYRVPSGLPVDRL